ncbi:MAG: hypothetical protein HS116_07665 [Planctomycetes bacterium]|nr:hypothetical protein [Planctomycetota bacterium]
MHAIRTYLPALALGWILVSAAPLAAGEAAPPGASEVPDETVVVAGEPYSGSLLQPPTDAAFRFKLKETGDILTLRWSSLAPDEARRIRKLYGLPEEGPVERPRSGEKVAGVRFKLNTGRSIEGLELPDRARPGFRALKTPSQLMQVPAPGIVGEEAVELDASDVYSARELYDRRMLERPPAKNAAKDHLDFARWCGQMKLHEQALDHLNMAESIDPRLVERSAEFRAEQAAKFADQQAEALYRGILTDMDRQLYAAAVEKIERLKQNFPNSEYYTKCDALQPKAEKLRAENYQKQVVLLYYTYFSELIQAKVAERTRVDDKGRPVPSVPGKQVTTKHGHVFRGTLGGDGTEKVTIQQLDGTTVEIPRAEIVSTQDIDLSEAHHTVAKTYDELRQYVTDAEGGLGKDVIVRIAKVLGSDEAKVRDAWQGRFNQTAAYENGQLVKSKVWASVHETSYGLGGWLREGSTYLQEKQAQQALTQAQNPQRPRTTGNNPNNASNLVPADAQEDPAESDDPNVWWTAQRSETQVEILRAMAAEKLFRVKQVHTVKRGEYRGKLEYKIVYE